MQKIFTTGINYETFVLLYLTTHVTVLQQSDVLGKIKINLQRTKTSKQTKKQTKNRAVYAIYY